MLLGTMTCYWSGINYCVKFIAKSTFYANPSITLAEKPDRSFNIALHLEQKYSPQPIAVSVAKQLCFESQAYHCSFVVDESVRLCLTISFKQIFRYAETLT